jgi:glycosyltransferase involved in cell wall biosynthesis
MAAFPVEANRPSRPHVSAVVPMFNEAENAALFLAALRDQLAAIASAFEIIVVNDGSADATRAETLRVAPACNVLYLELSRNFGKEASLSAGIDAARGDVVVLIDADFQHPVELIPAMLAKWREGYDMVYGVRANRRDEGRVKRAGTAIFYRLLASGSNVDIPPDAGDFRLLDRRVVEALKRLPERTRFMKGLYAWVGFRSTPIEFEVGERAGGKTSYGLRPLARLAFAGITAFTNLPLRAVSGLGFLVSILAIGYGGYVAIERLIIGNPVPGYATIVVSIMLFAGMQLISIGIVGEYLSRVFDEVKQRPNYVVAEIADHSPLAAASRRDANAGR